METPDGAVTPEADYFRWRVAQYPMVAGKSARIVGFHGGGSAVTLRPACDQMAFHSEVIDPPTTNEADQATGVGLGV